MGQDALELVLVHGGKDAGGDRDQGPAPGGAGGEGVDLGAVVDPDLGHGGQAGGLGQAVDRGHELGFAAARLGRGDDLDAHHPLGHDPGEGQGDEGAAHAPDQAEHHEGLVVDAVGGEVGAHAQDVEGDGQRHQDEQVDGHEQEDSLEHGHGYASEGDRLGRFYKMRRGARRRRRGRTRS